MVRTDIRKKADRPGEIADKIELMGWHHLSQTEQALCRKHIQDVLQYLGKEKKKLVAAIHAVVPEKRPRLYTGKSRLIENHRRKLTRQRQELGRRLTAMTVEEVNRFVAEYEAKRREQGCAN